MLVDITLPKLGESITEGIIVKWEKKVGEQIKKDEPLLYVTTDKVETEIPSPYAGKVAEILAKADETIEVGQVLGRIEVKDSDVLGKEKVIRKEIEKKEIKTGKGQNRRNQNGRFYSPLVLNMAKMEGIGLGELETIRGTGQQGRVTKKDLLQYIEKRSNKEQAQQPVEEQDNGIKIIPMDSVRKIISANMMASKKKIPHAYAVSECDFSLIYHLLEDYKPIFEHQVRFKLTITTFIIYAVIKAIKEFPRVNSLIKENNILEKQYIHLGLAVATERGLIVPVLKKADMKNFSQIGREAYDIIQRGRRNQLRPDDVTDSTFTITNFGIFGNILGFPIINRPNSAILGVGAIKKRPVVVEGSTGDSIGIKPIAYLSLSFDHRIIDGDVGGRFLERIVYYIQSFPRKWIEAGL